jgi:hypothetical protein
MGNGNNPFPYLTRPTVHEEGPKPISQATEFPIVQEEGTSQEGFDKVADAVDGDEG